MLPEQLTERKRAADGTKLRRREDRRTEVCNYNTLNLDLDNIHLDSLDLDNLDDPSGDKRG